MRVTKIVREYIEESVSKALTEKSTAEKNYEAFYNELHQFMHQVEDEVEHMIDEAIENYRMVHNIPDDVKLTKTDYTLIHYSDWNSAIRNEAETMKRKRKEAQMRAVKDIILTLELGGTKADLDAMLSKVATEYNV
jgi:hypothetical protein